MNKRLYGIFLVLFAGMVGCKKDFIVENIENETVHVNAPGDNLSTSNNLITFWWDEVDGAEKYNLQIVKPNFAQVAQLITDTNVTSTKVNVSLQPGAYQWRIRAFNAGHTTVFQTFNLKIDTATDLTNQLVNMLNPVNSAVTGNTLVTFSWSSIIAAKKYRLQVNNGAIKDTTIAKTTFTMVLPAAKNNVTAFTWNVKAINDNSESQYNVTPFTFSVDLKPPSTPGLLSPASSATVTEQDTLKWTRSAEAVYDSIYIADDSLFQNVTLYWSSKVNIQVVELTLSPNTAGNFYWWRVKSFDAVGNGSSFSARRKFRLNP